MNIRGGVNKMPQCVSASLKQGREIYNPNHNYDPPVVASIIASNLTI